MVEQRPDDSLTARPLSAGPGDPDDGVVAGDRTPGREHGREQRRVQARALFGRQLPQRLHLRRRYGR